MKKNLVQYIKEIRDKMENLEESQKSYTDEKTLIAFRGEPRDFGKTKLMPSIFREPDMINKESYIFELMSDYNVLDSKKTRIIDKAIESQHYVAISRMLDITFSILPALYFACSNPNELDKDGRVYVFCFPEHYSPHSAYLEAFYNNLMNDKDNITYSKNFKVIGNMINKVVQGWINYYTHYYKSEFYEVLRYINQCLIKWVRRSYKKKNTRSRAEHWLGAVARRDRNLFAHWKFGILPSVGEGAV